MTLPTPRPASLLEAAEHLAWAAEVEIQGGHRTRSFIQQHRAKVAYWIKSVRDALSTPSLAPAPLVEAAQAVVEANEELQKALEEIPAADAGSRHDGIFPKVRAREADLDNEIGKLAKALTPTHPEGNPT